jgi:hypothetical protein
MGGVEETAVLIVNLEERGVTGAVTIPQTPSEWLLARYDRVLRREFGPQGDVRRLRYARGSNFDRRIYDVLDDHPGAVCMLDTEGECFAWSGQASWPVAIFSDDMVGSLLEEIA